MSERAPAKHENEKQHESHGEHHEKAKQTAEAGKHAKHEAKDQIENIRSSIEKEAIKSADKKREQAEDAEQGKTHGHAIVDKNLKKKAYQKELHRIQTHLPKRQRAFSKVIHNKTVEAVSEVSGKTVARPSGLLGGGIVAFIGTLGLVIISRYLGFSYNFFVFLALLVGGFFLGLLIELVVRGVMKARS